MFLVFISGVVDSDQDHSLTLTAGNQIGTSVAIVRHHPQPVSPLFLRRSYCLLTYTCLLLKINVSSFHSISCLDYSTELYAFVSNRIFSSFLPSSSSPRSMSAISIPSTHIKHLAKTRQDVCDFVCADLLTLSCAAFGFG